MSHRMPWSRAIATFLACACCLLGCKADHAGADETGGLAVPLTVRTRVEPFKGTGQWEAVLLERSLPLDKSAILICDMWDKHWCPSATRRCGELAERMGPLIDAARSAGIRIIHCPSETMDFYSDHPARRRALDLQRVTLPKPIELSDSPLPIDDSDGGCDDNPSPRSYQAWSRQHEAIPIAEGDLITDDGEVVFSYLAQEGIENLLVMGVHTNMCVLGRTFGIRQMTRWGIRCMLVRDLTDTMYDPQDRPYVPHERGTELVVEHIERHWCPSTTSEWLLQALSYANVANQ